jgi:VanZ family protein
MGPYKPKSKTLDWLILILYTGIVYLTLYHARIVSNFLRHGLGSWYSPVINTSILLIGTFFLIKIGPKKWTTYLFLIPILGIYVYIFKQLNLPEERIHFLEYGVMGYLSLRTLTHTFSPPSLYLWAVSLTILLGWIDEGIQGLLPNRVYDIRDVFMNGLAGVLGILIYKILLNPSNEKKT